MGSKVFTRELNPYLQKDISNLLKILIIWIILFVLVNLCTGIASSLFPILQEETTPIWQVSTPINQWLLRLFVLPWDRWDTRWFSHIIENGYCTQAGTTQFHPLYPLLSSIFYKLNFHPIVSLLVVSHLSGILFLYLFYRLIQLDDPTNDSTNTIILFITFPAAYILYAPYTESLFLCMSCLCFYFLRKRAYWLTGIFGGLATLTRQQGLFLIFPFLFELFYSKNYTIINPKQSLKNLLPVFIIPGSFLVWILYRWFFLNDLDPDYSSVHTFIYSFIISPTSIQPTTDQSFLMPWKSLYYALSKAFTSPDLDIVTNLVVSGYFVILLVLTWKKMRASYNIYSLIILLVSYSYYTGPLHPYMGLPRHLLLAFPVFIGLDRVVQKPFTRIFIVSTNIIFFFFLTWVHTIEAWVP